MKRGLNVYLQERINLLPTQVLASRATLQVVKRSRLAYLSRNVLVFKP